MGLVMKSGVICDRIMRRNKKDHRNENAENAQRKTKNSRNCSGKYMYYFLLNSTAEKLLMTKKSVTKSYEM